MAKKRKLLVLALLTCLALVGVGVYLWATGAFRHRITLATAKQIREGMTESEVIDLIGRPPGNYMFLPRKLHPPQIRQEGHMMVALGVVDKKRIEEGVTCLEWFSDECAIFVFLDKRGRIAGSYYETLPAWLEDELPRLMKQKLKR